jgi:hypothetical protein
VVSTVAHTLVAGSLGLSELTVRKVVPPGSIETGNEDAMPKLEALALKGFPCWSLSVRLPEIAVPLVLESENVVEYCKGPVSLDSISAFLAPVFGC